MLGVIKWFDSVKRNYGFIVCSNMEKDVFIHISDCKGFTPQPGDAEEFEVSDAGGKRKAQDVRLINKPVEVDG